MAQLKLPNRVTFPVTCSNIPNDYVERATISLVREYLYKKGFQSSLKTLNHEQDSFPGIYDRRAALAKELNLECLLKQNKWNDRKDEKSSQNSKNNLEKPLKSMLEVLVKSHVIQSQLSQTRKSQVTQTEISSPIKQKEIIIIDSRHDISSQTELTLDLVSPNTTTNTSKLASERVEGQGSPENNSMSIMSQGDGSPNNSVADVASNPEELNSVSKSSVPKNLGKLTRGDSKGGDSSGDFPDSSYLEPLSPPSLSKKQSTFDTEFHIKKSTRIKPKVSPNSEEAKNNGRGGLVNMLQSKQDALAQMCLTEKENEDRYDNYEAQKSSLEDCDPDEPETPGEVKGQGLKPLERNFEIKSPRRSQPVGDVMELKDIEDEDFGLSDSDNNKGQGSLLVIRNPGKINRDNNKVTRLDLKGWRELKIAVMGAHGVLQEGWIGQGFNFDPNIPYGLEQKKGGPCGVLAVMQSLIIHNLMFGSEFCDEGLPIFELYQFLYKSSNTNKSDSNNISSNPANQNQYKSIVSKRADALIGALVEILWRCGRKSDGDHSVKLCLHGNEPGSEVKELNNLEELKEYVKDNLYQFDSIGLVYSAVLSRGINRMQEDMDFPNSPLLGQHGYCSQELVNLLLFGKCISNAFDNQVKLDDKVLQGIEAQSDIGLLSLFEHYGSYEVGSYLKSPKFPIWIVCSESHFSVLFSHEKSLTFPDKSSFFATNGFDLYYYDGLSHQEDIIRLTISFDRTKDQGGFLSIPNGFLNQTEKTNSSEVQQDDNLIPPLEKCIRTKWKNSKVFWNGTEPIL